MARKKKTKGLQIADEIEKKVKNSIYKPSEKQSLQHIQAVKTAYNHLLNGGTMSTCKEGLKNDCFDLNYSYSEIQADRIYKEARQLIIADFSEDRTFCKTKILAQLNDIYSDCRTANDRYNAINALKEMSKLLDLYEIGKQSVTVKTNNTEIVIDFGLSTNTIIDNPNIETTDAEIIN